MSDPLLTKRRKRGVIGHLVTATVCLNCRAPSGAGIELEELRDGEDAGKPYTCYRCGKALRPDDTDG